MAPWLVPRLAGSAPVDRRTSTAGSAPDPAIVPNHFFNTPYGIHFELPET
jgi:hypothetical protein